MALPPYVPAVAVFGVLLAQRVSEVVLSARHVARARASGASPLAGPGSPPEWLLYAVHTLFFVLPPVEAYLRGWPAPPLLFWFGVGALLVAQVVRLTTMRTLGGMWRIPAHAFSGDHLVTDGPYRFVRHPNHAVVLLEFLVAPLLVGATDAWLVLNLLHTPLLIARVRCEERSLARLGPYAELLGARPMFLPVPRRATSRDARRS